MGLHQPSHKLCAQCKVFVPLQTLGPYPQVFFNTIRNYHSKWGIKGPQIYMAP